MDKQAGAILLRACAHCGLPFEPRREGQKYHAPSCRHAAWVDRHATRTDTRRLAAIEQRIAALEDQNGKLD